MLSGPVTLSFWLFRCPFRFLLLVGYHLQGGLYVMLWCLVCSVALVYSKALQSDLPTSSASLDPDYSLFLTGLSGLPYFPISFLVVLCSFLIFPSVVACFLVVPWPSTHSPLSGPMLFVTRLFTLYLAYQFALTAFCCWLVSCYSFVESCLGFLQRSILYLDTPWCLALPGMLKLLLLRSSSSWFPWWFSLSVDLTGLWEATFSP